MKRNNEEATMLSNRIHENETQGTGQSSVIDPSNPAEIPVMLGRVLKIQRELDSRKALYAELDALLMNLNSLGFVEAEIDGIVFALRDNFQSANTGWTSAAVRRYEMRIEAKEKVERRQARVRKAK